MPTVPITPTWPDSVVRTSASAPGSMTSISGTGNSSRSTSSAAADAVLQATTMALAWWSVTRLQAISLANSRTSACGRGPYGYLAVSPT